MSHRRLVLASGSAARIRVLHDAGIDFLAVVSGVSEEFDDLDARSAVVTLAKRKALAVASVRSGELVLGCDSLLEVDGAAAGKPQSGDDVLAIWRRISGRSATLHTGHCLIDTPTGRQVSGGASTLVRFGTPTSQELAMYVATGEPLSLAGAFSIEGLGAPFVDGIDGDPSNVLGLSLPLLRSMLAELEIPITDLWRDR